MIKKIFLVNTIATWLLSNAFAQNLLLNPGLENYITCPGPGQFSNTYINDWTKPSIASTDYYHDSCTGIQPLSQVPHGGHAYFGIIAYNFGTEYREYATGHLSSPLVAGQAYQVEFYVSLNDGYIQAINELGAYFSPSVPGPFSNTLHIAVTPQIENTTGLLGSDSTWMLVSGTFVAAGGEQYVTIGNFHDDAATTITQVGNVGSFGAYYFVDDISVTLTKVTGVEEIYDLRFTDYDLTLYDVTGREILNLKLQTPNLKLDKSNLPRGIYIYRVSGYKGHGANEIIRTGKLIVE